MATKKPKKPLTEERRQEALRLKAIFEARKAELSFSQQSFALEHDLTSQQVVYQYLDGRMGLGLPAALKFAKGLFCLVGDFSPRLAKEMVSLGIAQRWDLTAIDKAGRVTKFQCKETKNLLTPKEERLIEFYRAVGKESKQLLSLWAESYLAGKTPKASDTQPFFDSMFSTVLITPEGIDTPNHPSTNSTEAARGAVTTTNSGASVNAEGRKKQKHR